MAGIPYSMNDRIVEEGEIAFLGMASRPNPVMLSPGLVQRAENMRFDRGTARVRMGAERVGDEIQEPIPLTLPFDLAPDVAITGITHVGTTATATAPAHGFTSGDFINVRGANEDEYNGDFIIAVTDADTFTYTMTDDPGATATGTLVANKGPVVFDDYTSGIFAGASFSDPGTGLDRILLLGASQSYILQDGGLIANLGYAAGEIITPTMELEIVQAFNQLIIFREDSTFPLRAITGITQTSGTATCVCPSHGLSTGMRVRISGAEQLEYSIEHDITVTDADTFTFPVTVGTVTPATGTVLRARRVLAPMIWDGVAATFIKTPAGVHPTGNTFLHMPAAGFGTYWQNTLAVPFGRDQIVFSDILDLTIFDPMLKSFRANAGSADYIVAIHPWVESSLLIFMRQSIYLAQLALTTDGTEIDPEASRLELLTNEVGCVARQSIATAGTSVFFLSDAGIYRLDTQLDLKLRGNTLPLSDGIDDIIRRIDPATARRSQGVYFANRYYLRTTLLEDGDTQEVILIFNTLNNQWESVDSYSFELGWIFLARWLGEYRLLAASRSGRLMLLEQLETGDDEVSGNNVTFVPGRILTRRYTHGSMIDKRILRVRVNAVLPPQSSIDLTSRIIDADKAAALGTLTNSGTVKNDFSARFPIRRRGHFTEIDIRTTALRPEIRQLLVDASISTTSTSTLTTE